LIVKQHFGADFAALLAYALDPERDGHAEARIFESNVGHQDPKVILSNLEALAARRPRVSKPVWHVILALAPAERAQLDAPGARGLPAAFFAAMGISRIPYVAVRHAEGLHIIASKVGSDGRPINLWRSIQRGAAAARRIAPAFGLSAPGPAGPCPRPALTRGEMALALRVAREQDLPPPKYVLAAAITLALEPGTASPAAFAANLDRLGVAVTFHTTAQHAINGARYTLRHSPGPMAASLTGARIGQGYTWTNLARALAGECREPTLVARRREILDEAARLVARSRLRTDEGAAHAASPAPPAVSRAPEPARPATAEAGGGSDLGSERGHPLAPHPGAPDRPGHPGPPYQSHQPADPRPKPAGAAEPPPPRPWPSLTAAEQVIWDQLVAATAHRYSAHPRGTQVLKALCALARRRPDHPYLGAVLADPGTTELARAAIRAALPAQDDRPRPGRSR